MKRLTCFAVMTAALFAVTGASAATVSISENLDLSPGTILRIDLPGVVDVHLSFASKNNSNFGGEVTWSTSEVGLEDDAGRPVISAGSSYGSGKWSINENSSSHGVDTVVNIGPGNQNKRARGNPVSNEPADTLSILFDKRGATVLLQFDTKQGSGTVTYTATRAALEAAPLTPVPLPAGAWLLITAVGAIAMLRRRKTG